MKDRSHHLSLSRWGLAKQCSYWARPDIELPYSEPGKPARVGTITHAFADLYAKSGELLADSGKHAEGEYEEARGIFSGPLRAWIDRWKALEGETLTELRLRYNVRNDLVYETPRRDAAGYTRPLPYEVTGELDFVRVDRDLVEVVDLKTGKESESAIEQLNAYAVLASRYFGVERVRHRVLYARKTKLIETPWIEMGPDDLDAEAGAMARVLRKLPTVMPPSPPPGGKTCSFICPMGRATCPAWADRESAATMPPDYFGGGEAA